MSPEPIAEVASNTSSSEMVKVSKSESSENYKPKGENSNNKSSGQKQHDDTDSEGYGINKAKHNLINDKNSLNTKPSAYSEDKPPHSSNEELAMNQTATTKSQQSSNENDDGLRQNTSDREENAETNSNEIQISTKSQGTDRSDRGEIIDSHPLDNQLDNRYEDDNDKGNGQKMSYKDDEQSQIEEVDNDNIKGENLIQDVDKIDEKVEIDEKTTDDEKLERENVMSKKDGQQDSYNIKSHQDIHTKSDKTKAEEDSAQNKSLNSMSMGVLEHEKKSSTKRSFFSTKKRKSLIFGDRPIICKKYSIVIANSKNCSSSFINQLLNRKQSIYIVYTTEKAKKHISAKIHDKSKNATNIEPGSIYEINRILDNLSNLEAVTTEICSFPGKPEGIYLIADTTKKNKRIANADGIEECFFRNLVVPYYLITKTNPEKHIILYDESDFDIRKHTINVPQRNDLFMQKMNDISEEAKIDARKTVIASPDKNENINQTLNSKHNTDPTILIYFFILCAIESHKEYMQKKSFKFPPITVYCLKAKKKFFSQSFAQSIDNVLVNENQKFNANKADVALFDGRLPMNLPASFKFSENALIAFMNIMDSIIHRNFEVLSEMIKYFSDKGVISLRTYEEIMSCNEPKTNDGNMNEKQKNNTIGQIDQNKTSIDVNRIEGNKEVQLQSNREENMDQKSKLNPSMQVNENHEKDHKNNDNKPKIIHSSTKFDANGNKVVKIVRRFDDGSGYIVKKTFDSEMKLIRKQRKNIANVPLTVS